VKAARVQAHIPRGQRAVEDLDELSAISVQGDGRVNTVQADMVALRAGVDGRTELAVVHAYQLPVTAVEATPDEVVAIAGNGGSVEVAVVHKAAQQTEFVLIRAAQFHGIRLNGNSAIVAATRAGPHGIVGFIHG